MQYPTVNCLDIIFILILCCILNEKVMAFNEDLRLHQVFPDDYDKSQPPWSKDDPAHVYLQLSVMDVDKIDDGAMEYSLQTYLAEMWKDHRLNISGFFSKLDKYFNFPTNLVDYMWIPDLVFDNTKNGMVFHLAQPNRVIRLQSDGTFRRSSRYNLIVGCQMNFRLYPIDTQKCYLKFGSMTNSDLKVLLHWAEDLPSKKSSIVFTDDIQPLKYILEKPKAYKNTEVWTSGNYTYLYANFTFVRRVSGSIFNTYVPSTLVVFLSWISFWLDIEAVPARVTLGVTSLLTLATQMVQAHSGLPPISYMTAMDVWLFVCLNTVFSSLIEFAISYHLHTSKKKQTFINESAKKVTSVIPREEICMMKSRMRQNVTIKSALHRGSSGKSMIIPSAKNKQISLDSISRKLFPVAFFLFAAIYWTYYLEATKQ